LEQANARRKGHEKGFPCVNGQNVRVQNETKPSDITSTDYGIAP
jgi:hypothetical protein